MIIFTTIGFSQKITGVYKLNKKDYTLTLKSNGEFERVFSVGWCGVGIYTKGTYKLESDKLNLNYRDLDFDNPKIKNIKVNDSERTDSLQTINVKIVDINSKNVSEYYYVEQDYEIYFPEFESDIKIKINPTNGVFSIRSTQTILNEIEVIAGKDYQVNIEIEPNVERQDIFKIIKQKENLLILKDIEFNKRLKFIKN